jgi:hypothetical protein
VLTSSNAPTAKTASESDAPSNIIDLTTTEPTKKAQTTLAGSKQKATEETQSPHPKRKSHRPIRIARLNQLAQVGYS